MLPGEEFLRSSMMSTFCAHRRDADFCTTCWPTCCSEELASECTRGTRVWNQAGECPPNMQVLGPEVWSPEGVKILGTLLDMLTSFRLQ